MGKNGKQSGEQEGAMDKLIFKSPTQQARHTQTIAYNLELNTIAKTFTTLVSA
jgi:hypothetical protein